MLAMGYLEKIVFAQSQCLTNCSQTSRAVPTAKDDVAGGRTKQERLSVDKEKAEQNGKGFQLTKRKSRAE